jgi:hypothetical protein
MGPLGFVFQPVVETRESAGEAGRTATRQPLPLFVSAAPFLL